MLNKRLLKLRKESKLTQVELSYKLGMARTTYSGYELGTSEPDNDTLKRISDFYNVSTDYLLGVDVKESSLEQTELERKKNKLKNIIDAMNDENELDYTAETINRLIGKK